MKKRFYAAAALCLVLLCFLGIWQMGQTYTVRVDVPGGELSDYRVDMEGAENLALLRRRLEDGKLVLTFQSISPGRVYVDIYGPGGETVTSLLLYVHSLGIVTFNSFLGDSTGAWLIQAAVILYLALLLFGVVKRYRRGVRENLYQYRNVRNLGLAVFLAVFLLNQLSLCLNYRGPVDTLRSALYSAQNFALVALPVAFVFSLIVTASNLRLMRKEGRNWRNMLGCILGVLICLGTLTKLLQDRADRAVEFARMQREATGKELVFVPSGGRGPDEVTSEAAAIQRYLLGLGIHERQIMIEDQSANTYENLGNSARLIRESGGGNIAFSTTNYHVFRAGKLAADQGIRAEGIGSPTKSYFWINAFIREFIATLHSEFWAHLRVMGILVGVILGMVLLVRVANVL